MHELSHAQYRIWLSNRLAEPSVMYHVPVPLRLTGRLDKVALEQAIWDVVTRHEILRTIYPETARGPRQRVLGPHDARPRLLAIDCAGGDHAQAASRAALAPFELTRDIPLRAYLLATGDHDHILLLVLHHIAFDGWSLGPLLDDLQRAYAARRSCREPAWAELPVQYADYAHWHGELLGDPGDETSLAASQLSYWRAALRDLPAEISLPADRVRPPVSDYVGASTQIRISADTHVLLAALGRAEQATMFMVFHAAVAALLTRLGAGTDIAIGTPVSGRVDALLTELVGCFNNLVVLRVQTEADPSFRELLRRAREADLAALSHQDVPFEQVVAALNPPRSASAHPLFQVMLVAEAQLSDTGISFPELEARTEEPIDIGTAKVDLTVGFAEATADDGAPGGIAGLVEYAAALFDPGSGDAIADRLMRLLCGAARNPDLPISQIDLLTAAERRRLVSGWNATSAELPEWTVTELIEGQAATDPDRIAVECGQVRLSYGEMNARANRLAGYLTALGAGPEQVVAIRLPSTEELLVAILAVLKAGSAYLPIDTDWPARRIEYTIADSRARILLTHASLDSAISHGTTVIRLDDAATGAKLARYPDTDPAASRLGRTRRQAAYVIYTSGSTGLPKGVVVEHRSLANYLCWVRESYPAAARTVLGHSSAAYDMSITSLFGPLISGGSLRLAGLEPEPLDRGSRAAFIKLTPSHLAVVATFADGWLAPDTFVVGGESLSTAEVQRLRDRYPATEVVNEYGPTEATVGCITFRVNAIDPLPSASGAIPIGRPIRNARCYVLDDRLDLVPTGVAGELYVAGEILARGYADQPALTAEKFIPCPFGRSGERMYRTGDRVRWRMDGNLVFLERTDDQVKVHGFRVEPGEVESCLRRHQDVASVAVAVRPDHRGQDHLVAYVVPWPGRELAAAALRAYAAQWLPRPMVPSSVMFVDRLPRTPSGKLDLLALPEPTFGPPARTGDQPTSSTERMVRRLFADVLGLDRVGQHDSFFEIGGTSILAAELLARLAVVIGYRLPLHVMYSCPSPGELTAMLTAMLADGGPPAAPAGAAPAQVRVSIDRLPPRSGREVKAVLLTGATGFLGAHLLHELLERTSGHVYCLVRAPDQALGYDRVAASLARFGRERPDLASRVTAIPGDLAQHRLGQGDAAYATLSQDVDVIYHCGAAVRALLPYAELERTNVNATIELVRLAATGVLKELHYISSVDAAAADLSAMGTGVAGYAITKRRAEEAVVQARRAGVPASIFRLPRLSADSVSGQWNDHDVMARILRVVAALGVAPDLQISEFWVPVDQAASLLVRQACRHPGGGLYTVTTAHPVEMHTIAAISGPAGRGVELIPTRQWLRKVADYNEAEHDLLAAIVAEDSFNILKNCREPADARFQPLLAADLDDAGLRACLSAMVNAESRC